MEKKKSFNWWLLLLSMTFMAACSSGGEDAVEPAPKPTPVQPTITLDTSVSDFTTDGGSNTISFKASTAWTVDVINARAAGWCSVSPTSGNAGDAEITVTTQPNDTPDDRSASIVIKAGSTQKTITVSQKQKDALTVTSSKFEVSSEGGEVKIEVKANINFEYTIDEKAKGWITSSSSRALKTSTLIFNVAANEENEKREGNITISSGEFKETVTVYQAGSQPSITLTKNEFIVPSAGETIAVEVKSNVDVEVELPAGVDWINENLSRAMSTNTYYFVVNENKEYDLREAEIKFTNKENGLSETVRVVQAQKDAIVLAKSEYEIDNDGGELDFEIQTNVDFSVEISENAKNWITQVQSRGLEAKSLYFDIAPYELDDERTGTITLTGGDATQVITVKQNGLKAILEAERNALIAFYNATGGDNWKKNDNWCSDKPLSEWYGVTIENNRVTHLALTDNNLKGAITNELDELTELQGLYLTFNELTTLNVTKNLKLEFLRCGYNNLNLLDFSSPLLADFECNNNQLTDIDVSNCNNLKYFRCDNNNISVLDITNCLLLENFHCHHNDLKSLDVTNCPKLYNIECEENSIANLDVTNCTELINLSCSKNALTNLDVSKCMDLSQLACDSNKISVLDISKNDKLENLNLNHNQISAIEVSHLTKLKELWCAENLISNLDVSQNLALEYFSCRDNNLSQIDVKNNTELISLECSANPIVSLNLGNNNKLTSLYCNRMPNLTSLDVSPCPLLVFLCVEKSPNLSTLYVSSEQNIETLIIDAHTQLCTIGEDSDVYTSTDFSRNGEVTTLQQATVGNGIDIVLMGDAYSDRLITDGTYDNVMNTAMEKFFSVEPYKTYRNMFNVYSVKVVSKNENYYAGLETTFSGYFGDGTEVGGNDQQVFDYALKAIDEERMDEALLIVMMNSTNYAGTCYMYRPDAGDYGNGVSVSYFPVGADATALEQVLHHEAGGHGFAKLGDEYAYEENGAIPEAEITDANLYVTYGWWKNVDFTNDPNTVKWSKFLSDSRYANEGLGVYEGAYTYWTGVYRPTENSIMRYNTGGFNAPSREAIYYRIHKLAYGDSWEYDYEKFVEYDAINRNPTASRSLNYVEVPKDFKPLHSPVVKRQSWKNAK